MWHYVVPVRISIVFMLNACVLTETVLCTVDVRRAQGLEAEASLKMWLWSAANHAYKLLTQVLV